MTEREVTIAQLGTRGDGIADDGTYVPYALPGEHVRIADTDDRRASLKDVIMPADDRVSPPCPHFGSCGGCGLQHLDATAYRRWKHGLVETALARQGIDGVDIGPLQSSPPASRRRVRLAAWKRKGRVTLGFHISRSHRLVDLSTCLVLRPALVELLAPLHGLLGALLANGAGMDVHLTASDAGVDAWLLGSVALDLAARERLVEFAAEHDLARIAWGEPAEIVAERRAPVLQVDGIAVVPPPGAFLQATAEGEAALVACARDWLRDAAKVADLYAGCGAFALALARSASVHAVDIAGDHLDALDRARRHASDRRQIAVERRNLKRRPLLRGELAAFDAVLFDPPRAGAKEQCEEIAASSLDRVVAISCNPATFARDARILIDGGFRLREIVPVDQFPWTAHLELAARFEQ